MAIVMDMESGKVLDEACNDNNDVYGDEALYATWAAAPRVAPGLRPAAAPGERLPPPRAAAQLLQALMLRLYASQG